MCILIVDDHPLVRRGIIDILHMTNATEHICEAGTTKEALEILIKEKPEITLVDINLGHDNGFNLLEQAKERQIKSRFVMLSSSSSPYDLKKAKQMEVAGYILKDAFIEDIVYAIGSVRRGNKFFSQQLQEIDQENKLDVLTAREKEVFEMLRTGANNIEIGKQLFITEGTVKKHVSNILSKLGLSNRVELMVYANKFYE
nr:response regulator transcription factor [uncultured Niameybacter sp.]